MIVSLRKAKVSDFEDIIRLLGKLGRPMPMDGSEAYLFHELINNYIQGQSEIEDNSGIILALSRAKIIGLVSYVLLPRLNQPFAELWIPDLIVTEQYRNKGIGKLLVQSCESIARGKNCYRIRLESRKDRMDTHRFYEEIGFQQLGLVFEKKL